jgi:hypothetical protein
MKAYWKISFFGALITAIIWCASGCHGMFGAESEPEYDNPFFDELPVIEYEVIEAIVKSLGNDDITVPYYLEIYLRRVTGSIRNYGYYIDEECTTKIPGSRLVKIDGKPPTGAGSELVHFLRAGFFLADIGVYFKVNLDVLPQKGEEVEFSHEWFYAKPGNNNAPSLERVRIVTESMAMTRDPDWDWENNVSKK